jgi:integrase
MQSITVQEFTERYLEEARTFYKSFSPLSSVLKTFAKTYGQRQLQTIQPPDIHNYVHQRLTAGCKSSTINQELALLRSAINYVRQQWGIQLQNPVIRQRLKSTALRLRYLSPLEARALVAHANKPHVAGFVQLGLHTGCRKNELLTLAWSDVDLTRAVLRLRPENTKANKARSIPLNKTALQALHQLREQNESEWVFANKSGKRKKTINWSFRKSLESAGIRDFHIHDLRHTFASWLVSEGVELIKVRDLLGHSSIKMTERYAHLMPERLLDAVEVLDRYSQSE